MVCHYYYRYFDWVPFRLRTEIDEVQEKYDTPTTTVLEPTCYLKYIY